MHFIAYSNDLNLDSLKINSLILEDRIFTNSVLISKFGENMFYFLLN